MTINSPRILIKSFGLLALIAGTVLVNAASAAALHTAKLAWNNNPEINIQGYKVHVGTVSRQYTQILDAGTNTSLSVGNLTFGVTYYFAVKAIGSMGLESAHSAELVVTVAPPPLPLGAGILMSGSGPIGLNWSYPKTALGTSPEFVVSASPDLSVWTEVATISVGQATGGDAQSLHFSWPIAVSGPRKFYRLTAKNWMGASTSP